jgi:hypothetical protein
MLPSREKVLHKKQEKATVAENNANHLGRRQANKDLKSEK